uniref:Uncharacterized protein n=1 Tax=Vespula pensylvanica TaxID=30213 RepID=A0A834U3P8_VESPE|nr:hypothetical protein H0235_011969 [Vespula pensylvanica]
MEPSRRGVTTIRNPGVYLIKCNPLPEYRLVASTEYCDAISWLPLRRSDAVILPPPTTPNQPRNARARASTNALVHI